MKRQVSLIVKTLAEDKEWVASKNLKGSSVDFSRLRAIENRANEFQGRLAGLESDMGKKESFSQNEIAALRERLRLLHSLCDGLKQEITMWKAVVWAGKHGGDNLALASDSPMRKVFLEGEKFNSEFCDQYELSAARGEYESFQAVIIPTQQMLRHVKWHLTPLKNEGGAAIEGTVRVVGYVKCRKSPLTISHDGWWPDILLDFMTQIDAIPQGEAQPLWVTFKAPEDASPGKYRGQLTVEADNAIPQTIDICLTVQKFVLPRHGGLRTAFNLCEWWRKCGYYKDWTTMRKMIENGLLEEYKINPGLIYGAPSWNASRLSELMGKGLSFYNVGYATLPGANFDETAFWKRFYQTAESIQKRLDVVREAGGCASLYFNCFDEIPRDKEQIVSAALKNIKEKYPQVKTMSTYNYSCKIEKGGCESLLDARVPLIQHYDIFTKNLIPTAGQAAAGEIWWYVCQVSDIQFPNLGIEYPTIGARLLCGAMAAKYRPHGFMYYELAMVGNGQNKNLKIVDVGPRTQWNPATFGPYNGDGCLICPEPNGPLATIRLENMRDGFEDFQYYQLLESLLKQAGKKNEMWRVSESVVRNLIQFAHDPQVVLEERKKVAQKIEEFFSSSKLTAIP
ncbi:MAG: DUF6067 family protein [Verrucomicrobiae bacterium]|nr:DUF6067 family protein [Verrucomicrobiae bacterium]